MCVHLSAPLQVMQTVGKVLGKKRKRKDYAFRRQFNQKPSIYTGLPRRQSAYGCTQSLQLLLSQAEAI